MSLAASYLQNAVVALSSIFGPMFLQGILSGQGAVALVIAAIQFIAAYSATASQDIVLFDEGGAPVPSPAIRDSSFHFFLTITCFAVFSLLSFIVLIRLPLYRLVLRANDKGADDDNAPSPRVVERKVRWLGIAVFYVFFVTLAVFPSVTATITSVNEGKSRLAAPELFVPLAFTIFAAGDWLVRLPTLCQYCPRTDHLAVFAQGRALPQTERFAFTSTKWLLISSAARTVFIPLFLFCNVQGTPAGTAPLINSDIAYLVIMFAFATTNGYVSTIVMLASVKEPSLEPNEIDVRLRSSLSDMRRADDRVPEWHRLPPPSWRSTSHPALLSAPSSPSLYEPLSASATLGDST